MASTFDAERAIETARLRSQHFALISISDAADLLGVSIRTLRYRQARGEMPPRFKHSRQLRYRSKDIEQQISELAMSTVPHGKR